MLVALAAAGLGLANLEARVLAPPGLDRGEPVRLEGVIEDVLPLEGRTRLEIAVARAPDFEPSPARFRVRIYAFGTLPALYPGQRVLFPAQLKRDAPADNPGQWDLSGFRLRHALLFTGSLDGRRLVVLSPPAGWRVWLSDVVLALLTLKLLRFLAVHLWTGSRRHDARRLAAPIAVPFVWAYVIFTGNQPPAIRSAVMATIFLVGMGLWERSDALNSLAIACAALLLVDPSGIADLSLQLSFIAVLSLILLTPAIRGCLRIPEANPQLEDGWKLRVHRWVDQGVETLCASAAVTAAGAPLIASTFHRVSFAGLFSNVICLPLCGLLTILAASGAGAFVVCPALATPLLWAGGWASALLLKLVDVFAALPGAAMAVPSLAMPEALVFYLCLGTFALAEGRWRWIGLGAPAVFLLPIAWSLLPFSGGLSVTFLAVGHGDAIVLSSGGRHALVDGGGVPSGADTGRKFVIPFLREKQIYRLDLAVLSHPHPDHALGLASTLREVPARRLWVSASAPPGDLTRKVIEAAVGATVEAVEQGHPSLRLGEAQIDVLGPPADSLLLKGLNDRSVVLRVRHQQVSFLLTGDIEADGEQLLTPGTTTVLKAPHHGSRTSSTSAFLEKAGPRFVVFCVGRGNRFGFPNEAVVRRYRAIGSECFRTDFDGAIAFESDGRDVRWKTFHPHAPNAEPRPIAHSEGG